MLILVILIFICLSAEIIIIIDKSKIDPIFKNICSFFIGFVVSGILLLILYISLFRPINPIDVYRGNTKLDIKYTILNGDTISIDSVVKYIKK